METGLQGKTALVTGGASGIGRGIALVLAEEGVDLAIASRNPDPAVIEEIAEVVRVGTVAVEEKVISLP